MSAANRTVVVITTHTSMYERLISEHGMTVVGAAEWPAAGIQLISHFQPDFVVADLNLPGQSDLGFVERIKEATHKGRVVLITDEAVTASTTTSLGVTQLVSRSDIGSIGERLVALDAIVDLTGPDGQVERRTGRDRRQFQDWSKVGWERRAAARRSVDREAAESLTGA